MEKIAELEARFAECPADFENRLELAWCYAQADRMEEAVALIHWEAPVEAESAVETEQEVEVPEEVQQTPVQEKMMAQLRAGKAWLESKMKKQ